jgi:hypothetical protein
MEKDPTSGDGVQHSGQVGWSIGDDNGQFFQPLHDLFPDKRIARHANAIYDMQRRMQPAAGRRAGMEQNQARKAGDSLCRVCHYDRIRLSMTDKSEEGSESFQGSVEAD